MKKITIILFVTILSITSGCKKYTEGYDVSPNNPLTVTPSILLSHCELALMVHYTGQLARTPSILTQQSAGTDFQMVDVANYLIQEGDNINEWNSIYAGGLASHQDLIKLAGESNPHYRGIAKVLKAMDLGIATDIWGDIPNSEALKAAEGEVNFNPHFDSQQSVIADIQSILSSAIVDLSTAPTANVLLPSSDDFIHGGDASRWVKTAWMLKARYANRLSKRDPAGSATAALSYIASAGLTGSEDDANAVFGKEGNELNQWYSFNITRVDYIKMGKYFIELLKATSDPRLPFYATTDNDGNYSGTAPDSTNTNTSNLGTYYGSEDSPLPLTTYAEMKFIEAEANLRLSNTQAAADAHNAGVAASVEKITGVVDSVFLAVQGAETSGTITLEKIMVQKYVALFTMVEVWSDWRRTNYPTLTPNPSGVVNGIPRRFVTSFDERINNTNAIVISDILLPVWWDE